MQEAQRIRWIVADPCWQLQGAYEISDKIRLVSVERIANRKDAYR